MAQKIPTFQSNLVSSASNVPLVQASGAMAQAQMFERIGGIFQGVADYSNKKLLEASIREQEKLAVETVTSEGFNPAELKNQQVNTIADQAYRKAALEAYSYELESDIDAKVMSAKANNLENPNGFLAATEGFQKGIIESAPHEMKAGIKANISGKINKVHSAMVIEQQRKLMAERDKARAIFQKRAMEEALLADSPEESQAAMAKLATVIEQQYDTPELRQAAMLDAVSNISRRKIELEVMQDGLDPDQAIAALEKQGIAPDANDYNRIVGLYNSGRSLERQRLLESERAEAQELDELKNKHQLEVLKLKGNPDEQAEYIEQSLPTLIDSGLDVDEAVAIQKSLASLVLKSEPSGAAKARAFTDAQDLIGSQGFDKFATEAFHGGFLTESQYSKLRKQNQDAIANPFEDNPVIAEPMDRLIATKYPIYAARKDSPNPPKIGDAGVDYGLAEKYLEEQSRALNDIARFQEELNTGASVKEVAQSINAESVQHQSLKRAITIPKEVFQVSGMAIPAQKAQAILSGELEYDTQWTPENAAARLEELENKLVGTPEEGVVFIIRESLKKSGVIQ